MAKINLRKMIFKLSWKKKIIVGLSLVFFLVFIVNLISLNRADVSLMKLRQSYGPGKMCRDVCLEGRREQKDVIVQNLKKKHSLEKRLTTYLYSSREGVEFKKELIDIVYSVYGKNAPDYINDYFAMKEAELEIQAEIVLIFGKTKRHRSLLTNNLKKRINNVSVGEIDRLRALDVLRRVGEGDLVNYYLNLLEEEMGVEMQRKIIFNLSNLSKKEKHFAVDDLRRLESIILSIDLSSEIRGTLILLLSDYYAYFPKETLLTLEYLYQNLDDDQINLMLLVDSLNSLLGYSKYFLPEASELEWENYFNN